jgi:hypothetical protein
VRERDGPVDVRRTSVDGCSGADGDGGPKSGTLEDEILGRDGECFMPETLAKSRLVYAVG